MNSLTVDDYQQTFNARGDLYNAAMSHTPGARDVERDLLIDLMRVRPEHIVCDLPAGGGYLADGLCGKVHRDQQILCIEPAHTFAKAIRKSYQVFVSPLSSLPLDADAVDSAGSLAGLHHLDDRPAFFREVFRIVKPGGSFAVADVRADAANAGFLNGPVDEFSETGHEGVFLMEGELQILLRDAGFGDVQEWLHSFEWRFESLASLVEFCTSLFGLVHASPQQVERALRNYFNLRVDENGAGLPWSLAYGVGTKPA